VGSTAGFIASMTYPAQAHANTKHLKQFLAAFGAHKPLRKFIESLTGPGGEGTPSGLANTIVNNHFDIEFFRLLIQDPRLIPDIAKSPVFDCVGHSYTISYM